MSEKSKKIITASAFFTAFFFGALKADAATLFFSPAAGTYRVGQSISMGVFVGSSDQAMNATSGVITFPTDKLEVVSLPKTSSIMSLWVQEPSYSNAAGTVNFEGVVLNPGFTGGAGRIITVNFRVKASGTANISFSSGAVLANDGKGTNILTSLGAASFSLSGALPPPPSAINVPSAPRISSNTHPEQTRWYSLKDAKFTWDLPRDVDGVNVLLDKNPNSTPSARSIGVRNSYEFSDIDDGTSYFHLRVSNEAGWSVASHYKVQIDSTSPTKFDIRMLERDDATNPRVKFAFSAEDEVSGIDRYEVQIDNFPAEVVINGISKVYETPVLQYGKHKLSARAYDKAQNYISNFIDFEIKPLASPVITEYPRELESGEILAIRGTTEYPDVKVKVFLQKEKEDPKTQITKATKDKLFAFVAEDKLDDGVYKIWAEVEDERGAKSTASDSVNVVIRKAAIVRYGTTAMTMLAIVIPLIALLLLLILMLWYIYHKLRAIRHRLSKDIVGIEKKLHREFDYLRDEIRDEMILLEQVKNKRHLTVEEERIVKKFRKALADTEDRIMDDIKEVEKEIEK